jgi:hypothetical protein
MKTKVLNDHEDKYVNLLIDTQYFFIKDQNGNIKVNDYFKEFFYVFLGLRIIDAQVNLNTNNYEDLKTELGKIILLWPF